MDQQILVHSELRDPLQRSLGAEALRRLAGPTPQIGWDLDGVCPDDWKIRVSTFLKAWAMNLDPDALLDLAGLLALAGHKTQALQAAAIVSLSFPSYAPRFFASENAPQLVASISGRARKIMEDISRADERTVVKEKVEETQARVTTPSKATNEHNRFSSLGSPKSGQPTKVELTRYEFELLVEEETDSNRWVPGRYSWNISHDGPAIMPPSEGAIDIRETMNEEDRRHFYSDLAASQVNPERAFSPETRACIWGCALANLAQSRYEAGAKQQALQYMHTAYRICWYPMYANNAAHLALAVGDLAYARNLFGCFLKSYRDTLDIEKFKRMEPRVSRQELERAVVSARKRLTEIEDELGPVPACVSSPAN